MTKWLLAPAALVAVSIFALDSPTRRTATGATAPSVPAATVATQSTPAVGPAYPLKMSVNHRYFVDQNNVPVLVIGDSPQSLGNLLTPTQQNNYFSDRQSKGFNAAWINMLCSSTFGCGSAGKIGSAAPFNSGTSPSDYDLSTPNETYFALYDATINLAASYGITVFLDPIETIDWLVTLQNNGSTKAFNYGVYVGNRYKSFPNIFWLHGNDFASYTNSTNNNLVGQVMAGIASVDSNHLQTIALYGTVAGVSDNYSTQDTALSAYYGANFTYTHAPTYHVNLTAYNSSPTLPVFLGEGNYEFEDNLSLLGGTPTDAYVLREETYWTLTSGGIGGYLYGNYYTWQSLWTGDQAGLLDTPGAAQIGHINTLMTQVGSWWNLVPDQTHAVVTAGYGTYTTGDSNSRVNTYCSTAANSSVSLTYCPHQQTLTVAMSTFSGAVTARWYDPSNGTFTAIGGSPFANSGSHDFVMPGNNADGNPDWVLLLEAPGASPSISGHVVYADTVTPGKNVTMTLTAPSFTTRTTTTDANGDYTFTAVPVGNDYTVTPSKTGGINGLESLDASDAARYVAGLSVPSANQRIAADADGDGILTSFDASLIARYVVGLPGAGIVGTWKFVPVSRFYQALSTSQTSQNLTAILVGDTGGNWTPALPSGGESGNSAGFTVGSTPQASASAPLAAQVGSSPTTTVTVSAPAVLAAPGSSVTIPITVSDLTGLVVRAYDLQVTFNPAVVQPQATPFDNAGTLSSGMSITPNATNPGHLIISAFQASDLSGSGTLLKLKFTVVGSPGQTTSLAFQDYTDPNTIFHPAFRFNAGNPLASTTNGSLTVNTPPTITPSPVTRQAGSPISNSTIATVNDIESGPGGVTVTVNGGASATVNGVTVSSIVNTSGTVTADVVAACGATNASFTLTATDGIGATATATLNVTVNANTAPTLTYSPAAVPVGGSTTVNPATGPADNGSIASIVIQSPGTYTGTINVNSSGVISISNATPFGSHTITIRATDNCGATTDATLALSVTDSIPPDTNIDSSPANPSDSSSAAFTFSGTDSGSGVGSFECKLDAGTFAVCTSPKSYSSLSDGSHTFQVRAIDIAGNQDLSPASYTWLVDTTGPTTTIGSTPPNPTNSTSATFVFSALDAGSGVASFECKLDAGSFAACSSPTNYTSLSAGSHTFQVRALDNLGNVGSAQSYTWVINGAPTIAPSAVTRQAGSLISNSSIATVNDAESGAGGVTVTVNGGASATVNGVTVSNIVNTSGTVTADVIAACTATTAGFTLTATDGGGATATATLNVTVNPNTAPTLVYSSPQSVIFGGSLDVTPTTATDNGSITGYSLQSVVPALTTAPTVNASGVVSVTNAQPSGSHVITIRVTDNCGLTTDAQFTLSVGALPSFAIDDVTHLEGNAGTTTFTVTVTKTGSTALTATVDYATVAGTATPPSDFTAIPTTTLTFLPADTTKQFTVLVNGDTTFEPDETFTVHLSNASTATISDADGTGTIINDDLPSIGGRVLYADTVTPGRNVTMTLTAPSFTTQTTTTDANGDYTFAGVPAGNNYTVTPSKTGDVNGLESLDASDTARYVAGLALPSANQRIAADADGDGILTSFDASLIARYVVGLPGAGIVGTWRFVPVSRSYPALSGDQTGQNFTAILVGDTGGDWTPSLPLGGASDDLQSLASASAPLAASVGSSSLSPTGTVTVSVSVPDMAAPPGANVSIPISVSDLTGLVVRSYDLQITFNPLIVQPQATPYDNAGTLSSGMSITPNATNPGHLIISAFQATDLSGSGMLLKIKFTVVGAPPQVTPLAFEDYTDPNPIFHPGFRFNSGNPQASTTNGSLLVHVPTAAPGTISGRITTPDGSPLGGAVINLTGTESRKTITDADGNYGFDNVNTGGFYNVTPSRLNYHFDPDNRSFSLLASVTDAVFTATPDAVIVGNVIDTPEYFVRQHYLDFLGREPDEAGFNFWSNQMLECGADVGCLERRRVNVSAAYFLSIEFQETGGLVDGLYRASYCRRPLYAEFLPDSAAIAHGVVVGRNGWVQQLETNKQAFVDAWVQRAPFIGAYGNLSNDAYVDQLIAHTGANYTASERDALVNGLTDATLTRAAALRRIVENQSFVRAKFNEAFVMMQYFGYLRRDPDESGYQFWLRKLNEFNGNFEQAEMVRAFLISGEYRQRFGP